METLRLFFSNFMESSDASDASITITLSLMSITAIAIIFYWFLHRRKMHQLTHQIPASVVKNYLDSIIQNSTALKSSLFRGGGLDIGNGIPSVLPVTQLPQGNASSGSDEINQKKAEISQLTMRLMEKERMVSDLEKQLKLFGSGSGKESEQVAILKTEISRLQKELEMLRSASSGGGDTGLKDQLLTVTKERDELKERLMEYEIIEEDLANLKRLQQENEQLKKALGQGGATAPAPAAKKAAAPPPPPPEPEAEVQVEAAPEMPEETQEEEAPAMEMSDEEIATPDVQESGPEKAAESPKAGGEQKSAEELLSEFEKMLG